MCKYIHKCEGLFRAVHCIVPWPEQLQVGRAASMASPGCAARPHATTQAGGQRPSPFPRRPLIPMLNFRDVLAPNVRWDIDPSDSAMDATHPHVTPLVLRTKLCPCLFPARNRVPACSSREIMPRRAKKRRRKIKIGIDHARPSTENARDAPLTPMRTDPSCLKPSPTPAPRPARPHSPPTSYNNRKKSYCNIERTSNETNQKNYYNKQNKLLQQ
jgi:hypothetical protein